MPLFDRLVIGVGVNEKKRYMLTAEERVEAIRRLYAGEEKISVEQYNDLTVDFAQRHGAQFIVKGVRSVKDFEFDASRLTSTADSRVSRPWCSTPCPAWTAYHRRW